MLSSDKIPVAVTVPIRIPGLPSAIICDIDGTLAQFGWRDYHDMTKINEDPVILPVYEILGFYSKIARIFLISSRQDYLRDATEQWLDKSGVPYDMLIMRKTGDQRKDIVTKKELFMEHIAGKYNVLFILEDRKCLAEMYRHDLGQFVLHVADGDY